jgi:hypothetical protein
MPISNVASPPIAVPSCSSGTPSRASDPANFSILSPAYRIYSNASLSENLQRYLTRVNTPDTVIGNPKLDVDEYSTLRSAKTQLPKLTTMLSTFKLTLGKYTESAFDDITNALATFHEEFKDGKFTSREGELSIHESIDDAMSNGDSAGVEASVILMRHGIVRLDEKPEWAASLLVKLLESEKPDLEKSRENSGRAQATDKEQQLIKHRLGILALEIDPHEKLAAAWSASSRNNPGAFDAYGPTMNIELDHRLALLLRCGADPLVKPGAGGKSPMEIVWEKTNKTEKETKDFSRFNMFAEACGVNLDEHVVLGRGRHDYGSIRDCIQKNGAGGDLENTGRTTLLHVACGLKTEGRFVLSSAPDIRLARFLIALGADPDGKIEVPVNNPGANGGKSTESSFHHLHAPLHLAVAAGDEKLVKFLLGNKANVNLLAAGTNRTPIFEVRTFEMAQLLVEHGAKVKNLRNTRDSSETDPKHYVSLIDTVRDPVIRGYLYGLKARPSGPESG